MPIEAFIRDETHKAGIPLFGITQPVRPPHFSNFTAWLQSGYHAGMEYMARQDTIWKREDPSRILPEAKSLLVFGFPYPQNGGLQTPQQDGPEGRISSYAWSNDYHTIIPSILENLIEKIENNADKGFQYRIFTDSGPILERDFAQSAGLGWIGKNTCLIAPNIGSYFFLAEIITDLPLEPTPAFDHDFCGSCTQCIEACPTQCISGDTRTIDSNRCISYLTIENKKEIPRELRSLIGERVFGCDTCQVVCPWNQKTPGHKPVKALAENPSCVVDLHEAIYLSPGEFKTRYANSPVLRAKRTGFLRNLMVALGNIKNPESIEHLKSVMENEPESLIRMHAAWALGQFPGSRPKSILMRFRHSEQDTAVRNEIEFALDE